MKSAIIITLLASTAIALPQGDEYEQELSEETKYPEQEQYPDEEQDNEVADQDDEKYPEGEVADQEDEKYPEGEVADQEEEQEEDYVARIARKCTGKVMTIVEEGDSLWDLATEHDKDFQKLLAANGHLKPDFDLIYPGDEVCVPKECGKFNGPDVSPYDEESDGDEDSDDEESDNEGDEDEKEEVEEGEDDEEEEKMEGEDKEPAGTATGKIGDKTTAQTDGKSASVESAGSTVTYSVVAILSVVALFF
jgi:LysM repeat protein